ncbi:MAG: SDR family oxidoreductase, partial [Verrucomicrobia bacterium]|nr:SDR family oxidoreductase [Verrucomicrobiota bacterium]
GVGRIVAEYLVRRFQARLLLLGRAELDESRRDHLEGLDRLGGAVRYCRADVSNVEDLRRARALALEIYGTVDGVVHAAGVLARAALTRKTVDDLRHTLDSKTRGTVNLDRVFREDALDCFVLFSSTSAVLGAPEGADYACGNSFLNSFAGWRESLRSRGLRRGVTVAIDWPLWKEGGLQVSTDAAVRSAWEDWMAASQGIVPLSRHAGLRALEASLVAGVPCSVPIEGDPEKALQTLRRGLGFEGPAAPELPGPLEAPAGSAPEAATARERVAKGVVDEMVALLKSDRSKIDRSASFMSFGFDSVTLKLFAEGINRRFGTRLRPSVFFNHADLEALIGHLIETGARLPEVTGHDPALDAATSGAREPSQSAARSAPASHGQPGDLIAIVGMSGVFPGSADVEAFWRHLAAGDDLVTEIPADRWDWRAYYGDSTREPNKTNSKWGGFIADVDKFDAAFFGITPREARLMDPQHRLFLQCAWQSIESAGASPTQWSGQSVGVFVGQQVNEYLDYLTERGETHAYSSTGNARALLANRVSFLLNFRGPSEVVDTACSSSLVALNRACRALEQRECDAAVAGGVNLLLHPRTYVTTSQMGVLSPDGRCKTFDAAANGYVKGEGVAALFLMRLVDAERGGFPILGLVRGIAVRHGGNAQTLTAPNAQAQRDLLVEVYRRAGVDPATVGFVEVHGTGTELGDPVEMDALVEAFKVLAGGRTLPPGSCGLGSVKTNIGHLEAGAGIAGVVKMLLALRHRLLPASLHLKTLNPHIDFSGSPFRVVTESERWPAPVDANGRPGARRAGVSSFGFGGTIAHVILEEYLGPPIQATEPEASRPRLIVISARNEDRLKVVAEQLAAHLRGPGAVASLRDLAYTLQIGRAAMESRVAFVVKDQAQLLDRLDRLVRGERPSEGGWFGQVKRQKESADSRTRESLDAASRWVQDRDLDKLAAYWTSGGEVDWVGLHEGRERRLALPTYPFEQQRFWIDEPAAATSAPKLAPLKLKVAGQPLVPTSAVAGSGPIHLAPVRWNPSGVPGPSSFPDAGGSRPPASPAMVEAVRGIVAGALFVPADSVDTGEKFGDLGVDSILGVEIVRKVSERYRVPLLAADLYDHPTIERLSAYVTGLAGAPRDAATTGVPAAVAAGFAKRLPPSSGSPETGSGTKGASGSCARQPSGDIAVIGMAGRFPGAKNLREFWRNLEAGACTVTEVPASRWSVVDWYDPEPGRENKACSKWGGFLEDADAFDPLFFKISPADAQQMDPQQRLFLESAWAALEDAGWSAERLAGRACGVFAGVGPGDYTGAWRAAGNPSTAQVLLGAAGCVLAARIAYLLDLKGPNMAIDTACSASLSAIHLACQSLARGESDLALAGGVFVMATPEMHVMTSHAGMLSVDGCCRTFDQQGSGFVLGEGVGVVVLKPLERAVADGDRIYAVVKGTAMNQDGATNGLTAPSAVAQEALEAGLYSNCGIHPERIGYVEAHGTGTKLGDPIEVTALTRAFRRSTARQQFCAIGSVKPNIGHTLAAAGVASFIKAVLSLHHRRLVPSIHVDQPNEHIDFASSPFYLNRASAPWPAQDGQPRLAAVSSFGFSGTNVHVLLEEAPAVGVESNSDRGARLIAISAKTGECLNQRLRELLEFLAEAPAPNLADVSHTLNFGRTHFTERCALVVESVQELRETLVALIAGEPKENAVSGRSSGAGRAAGTAARCSDQIYAECRAHDLALRRAALTAVARSYAAGAEIEWANLSPGERPRIVSLPTYPFARERFWIRPVQTESPSACLVFREEWVPAAISQATP